MTKRFRIASCVLSLVIVGVLILALVGGNSREPVYQGKTLSLWLDDYYYSRYYLGQAIVVDGRPTRYDDPIAQKNAAEAVRQIGTNAVPTLLRMIRAHDHAPLMRKLLDLARKQSMVRIRYRSARQRHYQADEAFRILGTNAACAVPELVRICEEPRYPASQEYATMALRSIGPAAKAAIPVLVKNFTHTNAEVRGAAVTAFCAIEGDPNIVVSAIKGMLKDPNRDVRWRASGQLRFGASFRATIPAVRSAIPELLEALQDQDPAVKEDVENALWNLAPEKVAKPIVVEDATPMVTNGVTAEALSHEAYGELWTLIPKGKAVRCAVYNSIITPVYLYRGLTLTTTNDHFLGGFEVTGIPTNSSVEVVFIVDHGQILLCARDYNRKQFVELRRVENEVAK